MCLATSKPKVQQTPIPAPPPAPVTEDPAALEARNQERRRAAGRSGRRSTLLAGADPNAGAPTTQSKTILGA